MFEFVQVADYIGSATNALAEAKKDNDFIYHERVPDPKNLPAIGKAALAKALPVPDRLSQGFVDLFQELVPIQVRSIFFFRSIFLKKS